MIQNDAIISILVTPKILKLSLTIMMQFDTIISIYVRHDVILQHVLTFFDSFMKIQGRHKKLFLGSLRAIRAIKSHRRSRDTY